MNKLQIVLLLGLSLVVCAMSVENPVVLEPWQSPEIAFPEDNPFTEASVNLGGALFFETLLSKDSTLSCEGCHMMNSAFADHLPVGEGIKGRHVTRNSPTVFNVAFQPYLMMDGKFATLEDQVLGPINEHNEFDMTSEEIVARLKSVKLYNDLSQEAYQSELTIEVVQKSIANFERSLISENSRFDQYMKEEIALTSQEMHGWKLFKSDDLNCTGCHNGFNFTNYSFENNGLYAVYSDSGRALITKKEVDLAKFKVPTLRNIALTYPYMHDGSFKTLESVIDHYAKGGTTHASKSSLVNGFQIRPEEKLALISFLKSLTEERLME